MRIMLLEDDAELGAWIQRGLREAGHVVDWFRDGRQALLAATTEPYDLLILDRMTPELDGLSVLKSLRAAKLGMPAIFLTAMSEVEDRVEGLLAGADDYLGKPFAMSELLARVTVLSRRQPNASDSGTDTLLSCGELRMDLIRRQVHRGETPLALNPKEFLLLEVFLRHQGRVLTKSMLLEKVWDLHFDPSSSVVETHVSRLRGKLDKPFATHFIRTIRGSGYCLDTPQPATAG